MIGGTGSRAARRPGAGPASCSVIVCMPPAGRSNIDKNTAIATCWNGRRYLDGNRETVSVRYYDCASGEDKNVALRRNSVFAEQRLVSQVYSRLRGTKYTLAVGATNS